jgi:hypothetical protein
MSSSSNSNSNFSSDRNNSNLDGSFLGSTFEESSIHGPWAPQGGSAAQKRTRSEMGKKLNASDESLLAAEERIRDLEFQVKAKTQQYEAVMRYEFSESNGTP